MSGKEKLYITIGLPVLKSLNKIKRHNLDMGDKNIICFGEILWDMLPEGKVLGGAPLNVLYHAQQHGLLGRMISAIGKDDLGKEIKDRCQELKVSLELVQEYENYPTGVAAVTLDETGSASYELVRPVAYDNILKTPEQVPFLEHCDAFVFGSLANRGRITRDSLISILNELKNNSRTSIFFDVNFRAPHYDLPVIGKLLTFANVVKLNDEELHELAEYYDLTGIEEEKMEALIEKFQLDAVVCTLGGDGAVYVDRNQMVRVPGQEVELVDTVGSGDAFLAAFITSYLNHEPIPQALEKANNLGAFIASNRGAIVSYTV